MGKSAKSQLAFAAKKCRPIKSFFVTKIPTTDPAPLSFEAKRRPRAVCDVVLDTEESDNEGEDEGHGGIETDSNYLSDEESGSYHDDSDSDSDGEELNDDSSAFDGEDSCHESFGQDIVDGLADEDDTDDADEHHVPRDFDKSAERGKYLLPKR
jgi:hypothetical protein